MSSLIWAATATEEGAISDTGTCEETEDTTAKRVALGLRARVISISLCSGSASALRILSLPAVAGTPSSLTESVAPAVTATNPRCVVVVGPTLLILSGAWLQEPLEGNPEPLLPRHGTLAVTETGVAARCLTVNAAAMADITGIPAIHGPNPRGSNTLVFSGMASVLAPTAVTANMEKAVAAELDVAPKEARSVVEGGTTLSTEQDRPRNNDNHVFPSFNFS